MHPIELLLGAPLDLAALGIGIALVSTVVDALPRDWTTEAPPEWERSWRNLTMTRRLGSAEIRIEV